MKLRRAFASLICCITCMQMVIAQIPSGSPIIFEREPTEVFSFLKNWAYRWDVVKDGNGRFSKDDGEFTYSDTAHLYFTANCKTNIQGGYEIRYCTAIRKGKLIYLNFSDGSPAYGSEFDVYITKDRFVFKPIIITPSLEMNQKTGYKVTRNNLVIYQNNNRSKIISGYIDADFVGTVFTSESTRKSNSYYFRGYFKTTIAN